MPQMRGLLQGNGRAAVFIHIPRTGGRSVTRALGMLDFHMTARRARQRFPEECEAGGLFGMVREPQDLYVSWYNSTHGFKEDIEEFRRWVRDGAKSPQMRIDGEEQVAPLDQLAFIDDATTVFVYPHLQAAIDWAAERCGIEARNAFGLGQWNKQRRWQEYYNAETAGIVLEQQRAFYDRFPNLATKACYEPSDRAE